MDPITIGAVLLAIVSGAGTQLGTQLWEGVGSLVRRPFQHKAVGDGAAAALPSGEAELATLQQDPGDRHKAVALAEVLLARSDADDGFRRVLENWWERAEPIRVDLGTVTNTISGGIQQGPVLQGRDFSNIAFNAAPAFPPVPPLDT